MGSSSSSSSASVKPALASSSAASKSALTLLQTAVYTSKNAVAIAKSTASSSVPIISIGLCLSLANSNAGLAFQYQKLQEGVRQLLEDNQNVIKTYYLFQSPLQSSSSNGQIKIIDSVFGLVVHHEIILKIETSYVLFSFGSDGLQHGIGSFQKLTSQRKGNKQVQKRNVNKSVQILRQFLEKVEGKSYHLILWNCIKFAGSMIQELNEK